VTTVYVTHDQVEAMTLGQRVAVLRDGVLQQVDTPQRLFRRPANLFVAAFIGSPSMNLVNAELRDGRLRFGGYDLPLAADLPLERVIVGMRPTDFEHGSTADASWPRLNVRADVVEELGDETHVIFPVDAPRLVADAVVAAADADEGLIADDERALFTARIDGRHTVAPGADLELALDTKRLHYFDPATGAVLDPVPVAAVR
jgi:multiple sugar transport system ATP-binding protein